jgi:hypothetical protein
VEKNGTLNCSNCKGKDAMEKQTLNHRKDRNPRQVKQVFHGMKGGIPVKVHHSTTPKSENALTQILPNTELTGYRPELQRQQKI